MVTSSSDFPTLKPPTKRFIVRLKKFAHFAYVGVTAIITAGLWSYGQYQNLSTDAEVTSAIVSHNIASKAHPSLHEKIDILLKEQKSIKETLEKSREDEIALGERIISLLAAEREPDRNKKAAAASFYREEYRRLIRKGLSIEDAMLESLRESWH